MVLTLALLFLQTQLMHPSGGIYSNLEESYDSSEQYGVNHQMLTESTGLAMEYAALANKPKFFQQQATFAHKQLRVKKYNLYRWRLGKNLGKISSSNATIDDLRIIDGYLQAYDRWGIAKYLKRAKASARGLRRYAFRGGIMSNAVWWNNGKVGTDNTAWISYFDFPVWQRLSVYDSFWSDVTTEHYNLVEQAALGNGLYRERYNIDDGSFEDQAEVDTIHQLFIANHLAEAGYTTLAQQTLDFFKNQYETTGEIRGQYTLAGEPSSPYQDISIYAQLADLTYFLGDSNFHKEIKTLIRTFQIQKKSSLYYGAFLWSEGDTVYSFVQLTVMRALAR